MRKFTLFLMSMFFVLGAAVANELELVRVVPSGAVTSVDNIQLVFSKDVTVTFPQGGLDVVNNETKDVVKVSNVLDNPYLEKTFVVLEFEQKMVVGKDGKEELQPQRITTPGTYSYTIPAGMIKSTDGEEFPETSFAFSVVGTFPVVDYSPVVTDKLEKIELTFDEEIVDVKMPETGILVWDYYYTNSVKVKPEIIISDDKKTVTMELETAITESGKYSMDLYQGVFISANGINDYAYLEFEVSDLKPVFMLNLNDGDRVKELDKLEITFKNVSNVELVEGAEPVTAYIPGGAEVQGKAELKGQKITVTFGKEFIEAGQYTFVIPAGMFTMDGMENEVRQIDVELYTVDITPLEILSVSPEVGKVDKLDRITIQFNQPVQLSFDENWQQISQRIVLVCGDKEIPLQFAPDYSSSTSDKLEYLVNGEWNGFEWAGTSVSGDGTYVLNLSNIVVDYAAEQGVDEYGYPATIWHAKNYTLQGTYSWTIGEAAVEKLVAGEGEKVVYDLLGRRVAEASNAGIYIVNGKKVVIK